MITSKNNNPTGPLKLQVIHLIIIAVVCLIVYGNSFKAPFMYDDYTNIIEKSEIRNIWQSRSNYSIIGPEVNRRFVGMMSFALNYKLHGMDVVGYHIFNLIVHALNAMLVYRLINLTFHKSAAFSPAFGSDNAAFFTALLFAVHPIQTSAVTYIVQRYASLATLFCLISIVAYMQSRLSDSTVSRYAYYVLSVVSIALSMKTKEIAFTFPVIIALLEFLFFDGKLLTRIKRLIPHMLTMLIIPASVIMKKSSAVTDSAIANSGIVSSSIKSISDTGLSPFEYLSTQFPVIMTYLRLLFVPVSLNLDYDYPEFRSFLNLQVALSFSAIAAILASALYTGYRSTTMPHEDNGRFLARLYTFGILWFFIALSVESSVIPIKDVINEYRLYYPSAGFFIAVTAVVVWIVEMKGRPAKVFAVSALTAVIVIFSVLTLLRNNVWADRVKLWEDTVRKSPNKARPHYNLGYDYIRQGRVLDAAREFQTAIILKPDFADAYNNLGDIYASQGRLDEALGAFRKAVQFGPEFAVAYNNIGTIYDERGQFEEAVANYKTAVKINPDYVDARLNLGNLLVKIRRVDEAAVEFQEVLRVSPFNDEALRALRAMGRHAGKILNTINTALC